MANPQTGEADDWIESLIQESHKAKEFSYCPYSQLRVAMLKTHAAINKAVSEGYKKFKAIAVSSDLEDRVIPPCVACRQVIREVKQLGDVPVFMTQVDGSYTMMTSCHGAHNT